MTQLYIDHLDTPAGTVYVITSDTAVLAVGFPEQESKARTILERHLGPIDWHPATNPLNATTKLRHYFTGDLTALDDLPVRPIGTPFQQRVWSALQRIPASTTMSYGALATDIGSPTASRAVGLANSKNPIAIIIPCHRVIGANAKLTGYAGGLHRKEWLLAHEHRHKST
jgi:methylated-DNA-[protein]-cysteine S-methyltransferase